MTTRQPSLLDNSGGDLPGPIFQSRPGWGGRLKAWSHDNLYLAIFRVLILTAAVLIGVSLIHSWETVRLAQSPASPGPASSRSYDQVAGPGQGMTHLALRALDAYLTDIGIRLDAAEHLFAVDSLARTAGWRWLERGETVRFDADTLARAVIAAKTLDPSKHAAWARLIR